MPKAKNSPKFKYHTYDVNLTELYKLAKASYESGNIQDIDGRLSRLSETIEFYCKETGVNPINFENGLPIIVPSSHNLFPSFFGLLLAFCDSNDIELLLHHHQGHFKGNYYAEKDNFLGMVEFICRGTAIREAVFQTDKRADKITSWIVHERTKKQAHKLDSVPDVIHISQAPVINSSLQWIGSSTSLNKLSKELSAQGYTELPTDFEKVFTETKQIRWLREPELLAFLLHELYKHPSGKQFKNDHGGKGYFKVADPYFYDYSGKVVKKFNLKDLSHNVNTRFPEKYSKIKEKVGFMLTQYLK